MAEHEDPGNSQPKKLVVRLRDRVPVETTLGNLFARHVVVGDLPTFAKYIDGGGTATAEGYEALGKLALLTLVCVNDGTDRAPALDEQTFGLLTDTDISDLVKAVAAACELESSATIDTLSALGSALFNDLTRVAQQMAESSAAIKRSIESSFGSLTSTLRSTLGDKFSALSAVRNALGTSSAVEGALKSQERTRTLFGKALSHGMPRVGSVINPTEIFHTPSFEPFVVPKFEETPAGRTAARVASAGEESARQLSEVAGLMGKMAEQMAALQTVFLSEVLPEWFRNLEEGASTTNTTLRQAESSLSWAKWALVASVVVSVLMTGWQVWLAREYKLENDKQQEGSELLMRQQLKAIQELSVQLSRKPSEDVRLPHESTSTVVGKSPKTAGTHK